jgi:hypothetical protein
MFCLTFLCETGLLVLRTLLFEKTGAACAPTWTSGSGRRSNGGHIALESKPTCSISLVRRSSCVKQDIWDVPIGVEQFVTLVVIPDVQAFFHLFRVSGLRGCCHPHSCDDTLCVGDAILFSAFPSSFSLCIMNERHDQNMSS